MLRPFHTICTLATAWSLTACAPPPPQSNPEHCTVQDVTPAVVQTVTEHTLVPPEPASNDGQPAAPAVYRTVQNQQIITERQTLQVTTPCPSYLTPDFIMSVQRALSTRGHYAGPITGTLDPQTEAAIRRFQSGFGLNSKVLSVEGARRLGLITLAPEQINAGPIAPR